MKIILFGATGMVGHGVLRECLLDPGVERVLSIGRSPLPQSHPKLRHIIHKDYLDFSALDSELTGWDACFFCLGVSSIGMSEGPYRAITYDVTLAAAMQLGRKNPRMIFTYVSGRGTDSSGSGRTMWARVKGQTENALLGLPFKAAYMFRPALIVPLHGIRSKTPVYQLPYTLLAPVLPFLKSRFPRYVTTTEQLGRAMLHVAKTGAPKRILESDDINAL